MRMEEVPSAPGGDRAGRAGIRPELDERGHRHLGCHRAAMLPGRTPWPSRRMASSATAAAWRSSAISAGDLIRRSSQTTGPRSTKLRPRQRRLQPLEPRERHAVGAEVQTDSGAVAIRVRQRLRTSTGIGSSQSRKVGHVGDPAPLPARSRVERADQEERLALDRHADAAPPVLRVAVAGRARSSPRSRRTARRRRPTRRSALRRRSDARRELALASKWGCAPRLTPRAPRHRSCARRRRSRRHRAAARRR